MAIRDDKEALTEYLQDGPKWALESFERIWAWGVEDSTKLREYWGEGDK